jgi:hypothetical protein
VVGHQIRGRGVDHFGHHRQTDLLADAPQRDQAFGSEPLERVGRGARLERAGPIR